MCLKILNLSRSQELRSQETIEVSKVSVLHGEGYMASAHDRIWSTTLQFSQHKISFMWNWIDYLKKTSSECKGGSGSDSLSRGTRI